MQDAVRRLETEMTAVLVEQWRGCSWQVAELGAWFLVVAVFCGQVDVILFGGRLAARGGFGVPPESFPPRAPTREVLEPEPESFPPRASTREDLEPEPEC
mgnify:CR=1 FL=1